MPVIGLGHRENIKYKINGFNLKKVSKFLCSSEDRYQTAVNSLRSIPSLSEVFFFPVIGRDSWVVSSI